MSDRRATVTIIQRGDPQIARALVRGVLDGKAEAGERRGWAGAETAPLQAAEGQHADQVEIVSAEADRERVVALVRVAVGNTITPEEYRDMITRVRYHAEQLRRPPSPARRVAGKLLLAWAMLCQGVRHAYHAQEKVLR